MVGNILADAHVAQVRELKAELKTTRARLAAAEHRLGAWENHFHLAALAAYDAAVLSPEGCLVIVDAWNLQLGARKGSAKATRPPAEVQARAYLAAHPDDRVWLVFDGPRENARAEDRLRISFTGGTGPHRADRLVCDYLHMLRVAGLSHRVKVVTDDASFRAAAETYGAQCLAPGAFASFTKPCSAGC